MYTHTHTHTTPALSPPPCLFVNSIFPFLDHPRTHAGISDLLLYHQRTRCSLGFSACPFITNVSKHGERGTGCCSSSSPGHDGQIVDSLGSMQMCFHYSELVNEGASVSWQVCVSRRISSQVRLQGPDFKAAVGSGSGSAAPAAKRKFSLCDGALFSRTNRFASFASMTLGRADMASISGPDTLIQQLLAV